MVNLNRQIGVTQARQGGFSARQLPGPVSYEAVTPQWVFRPSKWGWDVLKLGSGVAVSTVPISSGLYYTEREFGTIKRVSSLPPDNPPINYTVQSERLSIAVNLLSGQGTVEMLTFTDPGLATAGKGVTGITTEMLIRFPTTGGAMLGATGLDGILWVDNGEPPAVDGNFFNTGGYRVDMRLQNNSSVDPYLLIGGGAVVSTGNPNVGEGVIQIMNNDGQTHHVAMVLDSRPGQDELRYYFDGNIVRTYAVTVPGLAGALELKRISILVALGANMVTQDVIFEQVRFTHQALYTSNFTPPQP